MKVLLDENVSHTLRHFLPGHDVFTTRFMGWAGVENGELLAKAHAAGFHALLTSDAGIPYQQNPSNLLISVIIMRARSNSFDELRPLVPVVLDALAALTPGRPEVVSVG